MEPLPVVTGGKSGLCVMRGFTIVELMTVVAVLAVLLALAAPSFNAIMERWRVRQTVESLRSSLYYARSEAIRRGGNVVMQKLDGGKGCAAGGGDDWSCGWVVTGDGSTLQRFDAPSNVSVLRSEDEGEISFDRWGMTSANMGVGFELYPKDKTGSDPSASCLNLSSGGRIRIVPCSS
ncbi:MAG: GspH/FimT family pseudopilin [Burkholderiaceae bacterium]|nr:GspH/FimT family pseudopilin [Burkholderiaceae bacterium]